MCCSSMPGIRAYSLWKTLKSCSLSMGSNLSAVVLSCGNQDLWVRDKGIAELLVSRLR